MLHTSTRRLLVLCFAVVGSATWAHAAAVYPTAYEQYLVELINRDRADPANAAARYDVDLNEGLAAGTISAAPKQPLAINPFLTDAAQQHSDYLLANNILSHAGAGGTTPGQRMAASGYGALGTFGGGENVGYSGSTGPIDVVPTIAELDRMFYVDTGVAGRGHRVAMFNPLFKEIGVGISTGLFTSGGNTYNTVMSTEDFAYKSDNPYLTGVAFTDTTPDGYYQPGEGISGVTIQATRVADGAIFTATTWGSGGYSLQLAPGTYTIVGYGSSLGGTVLFSGINLSTANVKRDFRPFKVLSPGDANGDSIANGADYTIWADHFQTSGQNGSTGDFNADGKVDGADYTIWADHFNPAAAALPVPEPSTGTLAVLALLCFAWRLRR